MRNARPAGVAALGIAACLAGGWLSLATYSPPPAAGPEAPPGDFSASRAAATVEALAREPRPLGSAAHAAARQYLVDTFTALGLEVALEEATVLRARGERLLGARLVNLVARLPGTGRDRAILLVAHYDTVPGSPGAGDDASGVAAIVETVRALAAGPPLARDVVVLITDGEEAGLLGARAFVRDRERLGRIGLALNFEARGGAGVVTMFESSPGNHRLVEELARAAPAPVASSLSYEVYRRMPNDTDFSILRRAGLPGLNFAMIGRYSAYHTRLDTRERLAPQSLQHHGSYALALTRRFAEMDSLPAAGAAGVYFNAFGRHFFTSYSSGTARLLATLLALAAAGALAVRSRRHRGRVAGAGWGFLLFFAAGLAGLAAAIAVWRALVLVAPGLLRAPHGVPWISGWLALAGALLTLALVAALVRLLGALAEAADLWSGVLVGWTTLAVATSFLLPGASYLFLWPAAAGWAGLWLAERLSGSRRQRVAAAALAALPGAVLLAPVVGQLLDALTVRWAGPALIFLAWAATLATVPMAELTAWGRNWIETGLAVAALVVLGLAVRGAGFGPSEPATSHLLYALDADLGRAFWVSADRRPPAWTSGFLDPGAAPASVAELVPPLRSDARRGAAPALDLPPPAAVIEGRPGSPGSLGLRLVSRRGAAVLAARLSAASPFRLLSVDGEPPPPELPAASGDETRELELTFFAPPAEGLEIEIEAGEGGLELRLVDQSWGLPEIDGRAPERPAGLIPPASWSSDSVFVSTRSSWADPRAAAGGPASQEGGGG